MTNTRPLHTGWTMAPIAGTLPDGVDVPVDPIRRVPATIPGCAHTDLLAAGLIDDPYLGDNERGLAWIGTTDWLYQTAFEWHRDGEDRLDLVCDGLDTIATITLNGVELGRTANMHRSYRFDVRDAIRDGENELRVRFDSAYRYALALRDELGERPGVFGQPFQYVRKMACNFGWDWGPSLVTSGIWRPIGLHAWSGARLAQVRPLVTVVDGHGQITVEVEVERATADRGGSELRITAAVAGVAVDASVEPGATRASLRLTVPDPNLWWPRGHGEQHLYPLTVRLSDGDHQLDTWTRRVGFRAVRLDTGADAEGSGYRVLVNDVPIFIRGVNWIPDDCFPTRVDRARYEARFVQAIDAGVNYLRVWGGGRYESEEFYDLADEYGLLVGQDFLFACAAYPEEEPLASEVEAEAREHVARLTPHPSLVLWTGNNETLWGYADWGWSQRLAGRSWGRRYYLETLPEIVAELDPTRPYWPGSPYSGDPDRHPNDPRHGTIHIWDVWNTHDYHHYRSYRPRFVSEFGFQGPATYATTRRAIGEAELRLGSAGLAAHQKQEAGNEKLLARLEGHLPHPETFDDWHYATQLNQARAVRFGIEHFRSLSPLCSGAIVWQLNDCWPVSSWAAIDGDGRKKPLWYALRRAFGDRLLTIQPRDGGLALVAVNDGTAPWRQRVDVRRVSLVGEPLAKTTVDVDLAPGSAATIVLLPEVAEAGDPARELLVAGEGPGRAYWFYREDIELAWSPIDPPFSARVEVGAGGGRQEHQVTITATSLLRDLALFPDRLDETAEVDDALVTLLPGESVVFTITGDAELDPTALTTYPVLRHSGDLSPRIR